jgi:hypothetical protein
LLPIELRAHKHVEEIGNLIQVKFWVEDALDGIGYDVERRDALVFVDSLIDGLWDELSDNNVVRGEQRTVYIIVNGSV